MLLRDALKNLKFDKRLQEYNLSKGVLSESELQTHMNSLSDCQGAAEPLLFKEERQRASETHRSTEASQDFGGGSSYGGGSTHGGF